MDLLAVMTEVAGRLSGVGGLRSFATPPDSAAVPFAACGAPQSNDAHLTYNRASGRINLPVLVAVGKVSDRASWIKLAAFMSGTGTSSVVLALEVPDVYTAFDSLLVTDIEVGEVTMGDVVYLAATFNVDIVG